MKFATVSKTMLLGLAVLLASTAFASPKASLSLSNPVTVNGATLKPGDYRVQWEGNGPSVEVSFLQGNKVIAKVPAQLVQLQAPSANDAALTQPNGSGPSALSGIRFQGKKYALDLAASTDAMQVGGAK